MNVQKLAIAALLSVVTLASCQENGGNKDAAKDNQPMGLVSPEDTTLDSLTSSIPVDSANKMITSYIASIAPNTGDSNLYSLIVDAGSLRNYLSNRNIKKVKIMFAHTLDCINSGHGNQNVGYKSGKLTVVLAGYDANGNYVLDSKGGVEDYSMPCPNHCPVSGTAASNTITNQ